MVQSVELSSKKKIEDPINGNDSDKSSNWLSDNDKFDPTFQEMVMVQEKQLLRQSLPPDPFLEKYCLRYGIVPNQRLLDRNSYRILISKENLSKSELKRSQKLEKFLQSDKMTHQELAHVQELKRQRANLQINQNQYKEQLNQTPGQPMTDALQTHKLDQNDAFDELFYQRYEINIKANYHKKKKQTQDEAKSQDQRGKNILETISDKDLNEEDYLANKDLEKQKWYLLRENSYLIQSKNVILFWVIMYSSLLYPIEIQEFELQQVEKNTNLEVWNFGLEQDLSMTVHLIFFDLVFKYNLLEFQLFVCEFIFLFDIFINFFVIRNEDVQKRDKPITSIHITAKSYYSEEFFFDFFIWFPWYAILSKIIGGNSHILKLIKCLRLLVLNKYLNDKQLKEKCGKIFDYRFKAVMEDPKKSLDFKENRTFIEARILANNIVIALKILLYTILTLYFSGMYWNCFSLIFFAWNNYKNVDNYFIEQELSPDIGQKILRSFYFSLTTLSTVGLGDFYPKSDWERILGAMFILFGVALFSIIISEFLDMISQIQSVSSQQTDDEQLEMFFVALRQFNEDKRLNDQFVNEISKYMNFKWVNDKNNFLESKEDQNILHRVILKNERTSVDLYTKFIYRNFLKRFNRFFTLRKSTQVNYLKGKSTYEIYGKSKFKDLLKENQVAYQKSQKRQLLGLYYPFYSFIDGAYLYFMTSIFAKLEIRQYQKGTYLASELEDCQEILFVDQGYYKAGYTVNNSEHLKLTFGPSTRIGTYNIIFMVRHEFIIKSVTSMFCYAIRLENWKAIMNENPQFNQPMKHKIISIYARNLFFPLMRMKRELIEQFNRRKDYDQVICQPDTSNKAITDNLARLLIQDKRIHEDILLEQSCQQLLSAINQKINDMTNYGIVWRLRLEQVLQLLQVSHIKVIKNLEFIEKERRQSVYKIQVKKLSGIAKIYQPKQYKRFLNYFDNKLKDKVFSNETWLKIVADKHLKANPKSREKVELRQLYVSFMGFNQYPIIRSSFLKYDDDTYKIDFSQAVDLALQDYEQKRKQRQEDDSLDQDEQSEYKQIQIEKVDDDDKVVNNFKNETDKQEEGKQINSEQSMQESKNSIVNRDSNIFLKASHIDNKNDKNLDSKVERQSQKERESQKNEQDSFRLTARNKTIHVEMTESNQSKLSSLRQGESNRYSQDLEQDQQAIIIQKAEKDDVRKIQSTEIFVDDRLNRSRKVLNQMQLLRVSNFAPSSEQVQNYQEYNDKLDRSYNIELQLMDSPRQSQYNEKSFQKEVTDSKHKDENFLQVPSDVESPREPDSSRGLLNHDQLDRKQRSYQIQKDNYNIQFQKRNSEPYNANPEGKMDLQKPKDPQLSNDEEGEVGDTSYLNNVSGVKHDLNSKLQKFNKSSTNKFQSMAQRHFKRNKPKDGILKSKNQEQSGSIQNEIESKSEVVRFESISQDFQMIKMTQSEMAAKSQVDQESNRLKDKSK